MSTKRSANGRVGGEPSTKRKSARIQLGENEEEAEEDYDSDLEPPPSADTQLVSNWRLDPKESFSDWTIEILVQGVKRDTYHVHKQNLAVGPRKSEYFVKLFEQGGRFSEARDCTSRIELEALAADAFPQLLDYLYFPDRELDINTNNATALYSMAKYFHMRCLRWEAKQFWASDIEDEEIDETDLACCVYYEHAWLLNENKILEAAAESCSSQIMDIPKTSRLVLVSDPNIWLRIFKDNEMSDKFSCHMSKLIAAFAQCNVGTLDASEFRELTGPQQLPIVDIEAALFLIDAERQIVQAPVPKKLSGLQERCIVALSKGWHSIDTESQGIAMNLVEKQNPFVLSKILASIISAARAHGMLVASALSAARADVIQRTEKLRGFRRLKQGTYEIGSGKDYVHAKLYPRGERVPLFYFKEP